MLQSTFPIKLEQINDNNCRLSCGQQAWQVQFSIQDRCLIVNRFQGSDELSFQRLHQMLDRLWSGIDADRLQLAGKLGNELPVHANHWQAGPDGLEIAREAFYQIREAWLAPQLWPAMPLRYVESTCPGGRHPQRPGIEDGLLFQKYLPALDEVFSVRRAEVERDGELFHRWQNDARVSEFWEEARSREELDQYLRNCRADAHAEPMIVYFDGVPFGYVQVYWALEDRIGPYYDADDYDIGLHLLVGEPKFLGGERTGAWFKALTQFLYLLDPRTQRLVGEPRSDNKRLLRHLPHLGWEVIREFDFPHKRAALVMSDRETFFREVRL